MEYLSKMNLHKKRALAGSFLGIWEMKIRCNCAGGNSIGDGVSRAYKSYYKGQSLEVYWKKIKSLLEYNPAHPGENFSEADGWNHRVLIQS